MNKGLFLIIFILGYSYNCFCQVGINTVSPTAELEVVTTGNTGATKAFSVVNSDGAVLLTVYNNGDTVMEALNAGGGVIADTTGKLSIGNAASTVGDLKYSLLSADHNGWIKLDGRTVGGFTTTQRANLATLGFAVTIPNAANAVVLQNGTTPGTIAGTMTRTIAQNQLPNVSLSGTTSSNGNHTHTLAFNNDDFNGCCGSDNSLENDGGPANNIKTTSTSGTHTHTFTTSSLNGGVTQQAIDITPKTISANLFLYVGN